MSAALKFNSASSSGIVVEISKRIQELTGVQLGEKQFHMVESRLQKRILDLELEDLDAYAVYYRNHSQSENEFLISILTTHHTYFFRESSHFDFIEKSLPELIAKARARPDHCLKVWSAGCSRGQEVFSLAMFLDFHLKIQAPDLKWEIWGSDVDPESVAIARNGVYRFDELKKVPNVYLGDHWAKGTGEISNFVKVKSRLRARCHFQPANLFKVGDYPKGMKFDIIFCRNVFIYFTPEQIEFVCKELLNCLDNNGLFFVGVSETLQYRKMGIEVLGPSIYRKKSSTKTIEVDRNANLKGTQVSKPKLVESEAQLVSAPIQGALHADLNRTLKVLVVDDSPSIQAIMKQILIPANGFEIVGRAMNGREAHELCGKLKPDVMTLDIHMPIQTGLEYLEKHFGQSHPPVVIVSSASREDADTAFKGLSLGASDFVEKPSLQNMKDRGEEICSKLKLAWKTKNLVLTRNHLDSSMAQKMESKISSEKLRIVLGRISDERKIIEIFQELKAPHPLTFVLAEGMGDLLTGWAARMSQSSAFPMKFWDCDSQKQLPREGIYLGDSLKFFSKFSSSSKSKNLSVLVLGEASANTIATLKTLSDAQILVEDFGQTKSVEKSLLLKVATDCVPVTSFAYMSQQYFIKGEK